jgi:hypothetical protein
LAKIAENCDHSIDPGRLFVRRETLSKQSSSHQSKADPAVTKRASKGSQGSILQNFVSAENILDKFSA